MPAVNPTYIIKPLHDTESSWVFDSSPSACLDEVERLRKEFIQWKYPDVEPRLQRTVRIIQLKGC